jgi:methionyl-tRNA formyltransferase
MSNKKIKTVFIGTSDFGLPALRALAADPFFELRLVISQPDKKAGRGQVLKTPPVKDEAVRLGLSVVQPAKVISALPALRRSVPDLIVVAAYGQILPEAILKLPRFGCVNIHGSLLPKCRGAACIAGAILSGEKETGVTIMLMDKGLDTGPLLAQRSIPILPADTAGDLFEKLSVLAADLLIPTLKRIYYRKYQAAKQKANPPRISKRCRNHPGGSTGHNRPHRSNGSSGR